MRSPLEGKPIDFQPSADDLRKFNEYHEWLEKQRAIAAANAEKSRIIQAKRNKRKLLRSKHTPSLSERLRLYKYSKQQERKREKARIQRVKRKAAKNAKPRYRVKAYSYPIVWNVWTPETQAQEFAREARP